MMDSMASRKASRRVVLLRFAYSMSVNVYCTIFLSLIALLLLCIVLFPRNKRIYQCFPKVFAKIIVRAFYFMIYIETISYNK